MNPPENRDYERRLQELERELDNNQPRPSVETHLEQSFQDYLNTFQIKPVFQRVANWFNSLPSAGKVVAIAVSALIGLSLLHSVLQLVTSLFAIALLGAILYLVYKFFVTTQSPK
ncbi:MAG TPA: hypothetical protein V6C85_10490 [Allocoleopsis sp.]